MSGNILRVGAYCRVSTDREDQGNSFESQKQYFERCIQQHPGWELAGIFADEGRSGTSVKKREAFQAMMASARRGELDLILTKEISRFARNTLDSIAYTRELKRMGVGVFFLQDHLHTLDPDAELRLALFSSIAQEESRKISERVKWGQRRRMEQGVVFGRDLLGYAVRDGKLFLKEDEAQLVRWIFEQFVQEGKGAHTIARELREAGTLTLRGNQWSNTGVLRVLRNEKYCGDLVQKKTFTPDYLTHEKQYNRGQEEKIKLKNHHEGIVSQEIFEQAQRILETRKQTQQGAGKASRRYCFSGKIRCGSCGATYVARSKRRKGGGTSRWWRCRTAVQNGSLRRTDTGQWLGCSGLTLREETAMTLMNQVCRSLEIQRSGIVEDLIHILQDERKKRTDDFPHNQQKQQEKKRRLLDLYLSGGLSKEEFLAEKERWETELLPKKSFVREESNRIESLESALWKMAEQGGEDFYRNLLESMTVYGTARIEIRLRDIPFVWNYIRAE